MYLTIQFVGTIDEDLKRRAENLAERIEDLHLQMYRRDPLGQQFAPSPYAMFEGERRTYDYGKEGVEGMLRDLEAGALR